MKNAKLFSICSLLTMSLFLQGCDETDQAVVVGAIIGAAVGSVIADTPAPRHPHPPRQRECHGETRTRCHEYRDYAGYIRRECREVYDPCARVYALEMDLNLNQASGATRPQSIAVSETVMNMASGLGVSVDGAKRINSGILSLQNGDSSSLQEMGIGTDDVQSLMVTGQLSNASNDRLAKNLNLNPVDTSALVAKIAAKAQEQVNKLSSVYWQQCMASGKWSTPENLYCKSASWSGCSPETGASYCK